MDESRVQQMIDQAVKWHRHDGVLAQLVNLTQLFGYRPKWLSMLTSGQTSNSTNTNGTTPVAVFSNLSTNGTAPFLFTVKSVYLISKDTTAGNIIVKNGASTVATIAKGTVAGVMVGASSLANTSVNPNSVFTVESSTAGNATVIIGIQFPDN